MRARGFTLLELLVVVSVIAVVAAIGLSVTRSDKRLADVQAAARELAAYLRTARSTAMRLNAQVAVDFNIANGAGTSGAVVNNWGGGHWYRLVGPTEFDYSRGNYGLAAHPWPGRFSYFETGQKDNQNNIPILQRRVRAAWIGEAQRLPAKRVRFLALTDLDAGHSHRQYFSYSENGSASLETFPATYPRPWCGWWDPATRRLRPWGGYDPSLTIPAYDGTAQANSAFFYQGNSPTPIAGCLNPAGRTSDALYTELMNQNSSGKEIFTAGEVRPLVNADWMDWYIAFRPDGTVQASKFGEARYQSVLQGVNPKYGTSAGTGMGDIGDLAPKLCRYPEQRSSVSAVGPAETAHTYKLSADVFPATSFQERSGYWYITLCPDVPEDTDVFADPQAAIRSMTPMFRVGINALGDVRVVQVRTTLPAGRQLDDLLVGASWQDKAKTNPGFQYNLRTTGADGQPYGSPVVDTLVPDMLLNRVFWYK